VASCLGYHRSMYEPTTASANTAASVGAILRDWRGRRRMSQLDLANEAGISARHLSFVETGRCASATPC
jgi:predicted transcriptional regulator